jgi:predicted short-subunit dehydrogenase-like oxidoreductase (DUF2520 family)
MRGIRFLLVGPGNVGLTLGAALVHAGHLCVGVHGGRAAERNRAGMILRTVGSSRSSRPGSPAFDLLLIAVPDRSIADVADSWAGRVSWKGRTALHTSGALGASALAALRRRGAAVGSLHPLLSLPRPETRRGVLHRVYFGIQGDSPAVRLARRMVREMGGFSVAVREDLKARYHLGACLSSGYLLGLIDAAASQVAAGAAPAVRLRKAFLMLAESTLRNAMKDGLEAAVTGPIPREDLMTLALHRSALKSVPPGWGDLHRILAGHTLEIAQRLHRIPRSRLANLRRLLQEDP